MQSNLETEGNANLTLGVGQGAVGVSGDFSQPFWSRFYNIECQLNNELAGLDLNIPFVYNPVEYAGRLHCAYLQKYLEGPKALMFVGMNPGFHGMCQTGVPFGNMETVKEWMRLEGSVEQPQKFHPKRLVTGLDYRKEEQSGKRLWGLINDLSGGLDVYSVNCFMHNFCPLAFFNDAGVNITPSEFKGESKKNLSNICLKYFEMELQLVNPSIVVAVGNYVYGRSKKLSKKYKDIKFLKLDHPSRRSLKRANWTENAEAFLRENDLIKYLRDEL